MKTQTLAEKFLEEIEGFLSMTGMDPTSFGRAAINDPNFVFRLRAGRSPRTRTIDSVRAFIDAETARRLSSTPQAAE
jgi:sulfate adenylyltransferase subunit 2